MEPGGALSRKGSKVLRPSWGDQDLLSDGTDEEPASGPEDSTPGRARELGLDLPAIQSYKSNDRLFRQRRSLTALTLAGAGLLLASGCVAASYVWLGDARHSRWEGGAAAQLWGACDYSKSSVCPAPSLLLMDEVHELAAKNVLRVGHRILGPQHAPIAKRIVGDCFRNVSSLLERHARQVARELDTVRVTHTQKDAMLNSLRLLGDPRIEGVGLDIAEAISQIGHSSAETGAPSMSANDISVALGDMLQRFELGSLREELELARLLWSEGRQWDLTLEPEYLASMGRLDGRWHSIIAEASDVEPKWDGALVAVQEDLRAAIVAGALVQARVLLDVMKVRARSAVPSWVTSQSSYLGIDRRDVVCELQGEHAALNRLACPLKFGVQGMDALRAHFSRQPMIQEPIQGPTSPSDKKAALLTIQGI